MFTMPIWVAILYGVLFFIALLMIFLMSLLTHSQKELIERQRFFIRILKGED